MHLDHVVKGDCVLARLLRESVRRTTQKQYGSRKAASQNSANHCWFLPFPKGKFAAEDGFGWVDIVTILPGFQEPSKRANH
jgi:hypothetical protein